MNSNIDGRGTVIDVTGITIESDIPEIAIKIKDWVGTPLRNGDVIYLSNTRVYADSGGSIQNMSFEINMNMYAQPDISELWTDINAQANESLIKIIDLFGLSPDESEPITFGKNDINNTYIFQQMVAGEIIDGIFLIDTSYTNGKAGGVYILGNHDNYESHNYIRYPIPDISNTTDLGIKNYLQNDANDSSDFFIRNKMALAHIYTDKTYCSFTKINNNSLDISEGMTILTMKDNVVYYTNKPFSVVESGNSRVIQIMTNSGLNHFYSKNLDTGCIIYPNESYIYDMAENILSTYTGFSGDTDNELQILMKNKTKNDYIISANNRTSIYNGIESIQSSMWSNEFDRIKTPFFLPNKRARLVYVDISKDMRNTTI